MINGIYFTEGNLAVAGQRSRTKGEKCESYDALRLTKYSCDTRNTMEIDVIMLVPRLYQ